MSHTVYGALSRVQELKRVCKDRKLNVARNKKVAVYVRWIMEQKMGRDKKDSSMKVGISEKLFRNKMIAFHRKIIKGKVKTFKFCWKLENFWWNLVICKHNIWSIFSDDY